MTFHRQNGAQTNWKAFPTQKSNNTNKVKADKEECYALQAEQEEEHSVFIL
jgi:hypothetical protein